MSSNVKCYVISGFADDLEVAQHYLELVVRSIDGHTATRGQNASPWRCLPASRCAGLWTSASLLQVNVDVADLGGSVEFEHSHRVHHVRTATEEVPLFDLEVNELWQLGHASDGRFERID